MLPIRQHGRRIALVEKVGRVDVERLCQLAQAQQRQVLDAPLDRADIGPVRAHPLGDSLLAQVERVPKSTRVDAHDLANVHREVTEQSRIFVLRIIIRGVCDLVRALFSPSSVIMRFGGEQCPLEGIAQAHG